MFRVYRVEGCKDGFQGLCLFRAVGFGVFKPSSRGMLFGVHTINPKP